MTSAWVVTSSAVVGSFRDRGDALEGGAVEPGEPWVGVALEAIDDVRGRHVLAVPEPRPRVDREHDRLRVGRLHLRGGPLLGRAIRLVLEQRIAPPRRPCGARVTGRQSGVARQAPLPGATQAATVLLERERELSALDECLEAVRAGSRGRVVLVGGEAGVGKTALLRRFCEERDRSARVLWGACDPLFTPRPLGPLLADRRGRGRRARGGRASAGCCRTRSWRRSRASCRRVAPTVFVLEDVHWADEATLDVLRLLARRVETVPALDRRELPRRRARPIASAADRARRAGDESGGRAAQARPALAGGGRAARRAARRRRGRALPQDRRQPVLRRRGARRARRRDPGHGQGRRPRPRGAAQRSARQLLEAVAVVRDAGRALAAGGARR